MKAAFCIPLLCLPVVVLGQPAPADLGYRAVPDWPQLPAGWNFGETVSVAADGRNHVYVFHRGQHPIVEFDQTGKFVRSFGDGMYERPHGIRVDPEGNLWTVDDAAHVVLKHDPATGRVRMVLGRFKQPGVSTGNLPADLPPWAKRSLKDEDMVRFNRPTDVAFASNGDIYVSDGYGNSRVVQFTKEGKLVREWGSKGQGESQFNIVHSVAVDRQGRVYVADRENYRIQVFDAAGKFLQQWRQVGSPWGLYITPQQELFMSDGYNGRVLKLSLDGQILGSFGTVGKLPGQFIFAHHLSVAPDGSVYTAEILNWRPQKFVKR
jgi:DNA-binding beta-propeller fold protein YncE